MKLWLIYYHSKYKKTPEKTRGLTEDMQRTRGIIFFS